MERRVMMLKGSLQWHKCSNGENDNNLIFLTLATTLNLEVQQMFVKIVFSSGELERTIHMKWLEGFIKKEIKVVCLFMKSFYENVTNTLMVILFWIQEKCEGLWIIYSITRELMYVIQEIQEK